MNGDSTVTQIRRVQESTRLAFPVLRTVADVSQTAGFRPNTTQLSGLSWVAIEEEREDRAYDHGDKEKEGQ